MASTNRNAVNSAWTFLQYFIGMRYIQRVGQYAYAQLRLRNLRYK